MHDLALLRADPGRFDEALARRGLVPQSAALLRLDEARRGEQRELEQLQARRNEVSRLIGAAKSRAEDASAWLEEMATVKARIPALEAAERALAAELEGLLAGLPNLPAADVPAGVDETANVEIRRAGEVLGFNYTPQAHDTLGEALGLMDFAAAAKLSGARFVVLRGALARLERALAAFMLDLHTQEFGYQENIVPYLVRDEALYGTGQLPKFAEDLFQTTDGYWLIPTAEVPLTNLVRDAILEEAELPLRLVAHSPCFRSEAGSAGRDTRGMIRQHQFSKVELVSIAHPDQSDAEHEHMLHAAETVLQRLKLPYRTMLLSTGDMGFSAAKTYDIEVWLPGQGMYREISSCSNCHAFQARRLKARFRSPAAKGTRFVHTLNGSGLAVGRTLVAVLENYQRADGTILIPEALVPYMGGVTEIERTTR